MTVVGQAPAFSNACAISAIRSSTFSNPMESRTVSGPTKAMALSLGESCRCVVVAGWIGAAYWATSSASFANPAVTIGRSFSDTFAGIAPGSVPGFVLAQLAGGAAGLVLVLVFYPARPAAPAGPAAGERETAAAGAASPAGN